MREQWEDDEDQEWANEQACASTARAYGHSLESAQDCDDGDVGCETCPWREVANMEAIITDLLSDSKCSATEINNGQCEDFMMKLVQRLPDDAVEKTVPFDSHYPGHYWIEYQGRHYDAETPKGVENWKDLPIFKRNKNNKHVEEEVSYIE